MSATNNVILLHPDDNIVIASHALDAGDGVVLDGRTVRLPLAILVGHKLARYDMPAGTKIVRYGAPIGSLTQAVAAGEHVHLHNLKSDYIATHNRETVSQ